MPQENQILRCYSCHRFQVHLIKKTKKWQCKLCNSKQSFKQIFGKGSGKDCRIHAMKLNESQFIKEENTNIEALQFEDVKNDEENTNKKENSLTETQNFKSKWLDFINVQELEVPSKEENEEMSLSFESHYNTKKRKINRENNIASIYNVNSSSKSQNISTRNREANKLDFYIKNKLLTEKDLNKLEIKEIPKFISDISKDSKCTIADEKETKLCNSNNVPYEKQPVKNLKIFEDLVAEEELDEILSF